MTFESFGPEVLDYFPCRYGKSKLLFRGPRRRLAGDYAVFLGGIETYGKFIELPFPTLVEHETGLKSVNLGCANVGVDAYLGDPSLIEICRNAKATVIQVMGAQNMSNRFYAVHSRRNDRFLRASSLLTEIYGEVDFTEFSFTRHLLTSLSRASSERFAMVERELKEAWVARMVSLLEQINGRVVLLWLADHAPGEGPMDTEPMFIGRDMIQQLAAHVDATLEVVATEDERAHGFDELVFGIMEQPAAEEMLGPVVHRRVASELAAVLKRLVAQSS